MTIKAPVPNCYEFVSPTQKPIYKVNVQALTVRANGIQHLRDTMHETTDLGFKSELISAMNFSVSECQRELRNRAAKIIGKPGVKRGKEVKA